MEMTLKKGDLVELKKCDKGWCCGKKSPGDLTMGSRVVGDLLIVLYNDSDEPSLNNEEPSYWVHHVKDNNKTWFNGRHLELVNSL